MRRYYDYVASWEKEKWEKKIPFLGLRRDLRDPQSYFWGIEIGGKTYRVTHIEINSNARRGRAWATERETGKAVVIAWKNGKFRRIYHRKRRGDYGKAKSLS